MSLEVTGFFYRLVRGRKKEVRMDTTAATIDSKILVAALAAAVSLATAIVTGTITSWLTVKRMRREFLLEIQAEALVRKLQQYRQ